MIKIYHKTIKETHLSEIETFRIGSWIYVEAPTREELETLARDYHLDAGLLRDVTDPYEVPRLEIEDSSTYIFTRVTDHEEGRPITTPMLVVINDKLVMTLCQKPLPFIEKFATGELEFSTTQRTKLFIQLFTEINSSYNTVLTEVRKKVRNKSTKLHHIKNEDIRQFVIYENVLNDFLAALIPTSTILNNLLSGKYFRLYDQDDELIEDLFLNNNQLIELCNTTLRTIVNIREAYATIMSNNLNQTIKLFTSLTVVLNIPMIVASFYGMNVRLPLAAHPDAFWLIVAGVLFAVGALILVFWKKDWL